MNNDLHSPGGRRLSPPTTIFLTAVMLVAIVIWMIPLLGVIVNSLRPYTLAAGSGWWTVFRDPVFTLDNYREMIGSKQLFSGLVNSVLITCPSTFFVVLFSSMAAFGLVRTEFPGRRGLYAFITGLIIVPPEITLYPTLIILKSLHLINTFPGIWLSHISSAVPFGVFLMGSFT